MSPAETIILLLTHAGTLITGLWVGYCFGERDEREDARRRKADGNGWRHVP